jgi:hypothetical protein
MKTRLKKLLLNIVNNDTLWIFIKPFAKFGFFSYRNRKKELVEINPENFPYLYLFNNKQVLHGPFQGMKYPSFTSVGSSFYPKLLGSYETELHGIINNFLLENYAEIIDVGCAEGYYAIGLGLKLGNTKIYAYDIDETARNLCYQMAKLNNVENKVIIRETCTAKELGNFKFSGRGLVICDCEGYEHSLFNEVNIKNLTNCDLLIEMHDFIDLNISGYLVNLFSKSHNLQIVKSMDDIEKAKTYSHEETKGLSLDEKLKLYREWRPYIMEWLICTPKRAN